MARRALLTGGAGFVGSHVAERMLDLGWELLVIDNFDPFYSVNVKRRNIERHLKKPNFQFIEADIRDDYRLRSLIKGNIDAIVHLAAKAGVRPSIKDPAGYQESNVYGTQNLLELARHLEVKKFIFASSSSVYGVNNALPWSEDANVLLPVSPYASTKVSGELLGHVYSNLFDMQFLALRLFTVYGPGQRPDLAIHKFSKLIKKGEPIPVYGDGSSLRDYTYVGDIVDGIIKSLEYNDSRYEIFNLGNDRTVSLSDMIASLSRVLGREAVLNHLPAVNGDVPKTWANIDKAKRMLGYAPATDFEQGLKNFAEWLDKEG